jgi:hypothetical protein
MLCQHNEFICNYQLPQEWNNNLCLIDASYSGLENREYGRSDALC